MMPIMHATHPLPLTGKTLIIGFAAGFLAVLAFHQPLLALLNEVGFVKAATYSTQPTQPFGIPQVLSLSFWGGVWGVLLAVVQRWFPRGAGYWITAAVFGAVFPTLVAWFIVAAMKGQPVAAGGDVHRMMTGLMINAAWGIGTAALLQLVARARTAGPA
jgi:hypothetical protein